MKKYFKMAIKEVKMKTITFIKALSLIICYRLLARTLYQPAASAHLPGRSGTGYCWPLEIGMNGILAHKLVSDTLLF